MEEINSQRNNLKLIGKYIINKLDGKTLQFLIDGHVIDNEEPKLRVLTSLEYHYVDNAQSLSHSKKQVSGQVKLKKKLANYTRNTPQNVLIESTPARNTKLKMNRKSPSQSLSRSKSRSQSRSKSPNAQQSTSPVKLRFFGSKLPVKSRSQSRSPSPSKSRSRSRSPAKLRSRSRSPAKLNRQSRSPAKLNRRSKSPAKSRSRSTSPANLRSQNRSPAKLHRRSKSPAKSRSGSKSPAKSHSRSTSTAKSRSRSKSPGKSLIRSKSPATSRSRSKSPATSFFRSKSPATLRYRRRSPAKSRSRSISLAKSRSRSKSPANSRSRSKSPAKSRSRSKSPAKSKSRSRSRSPFKPRSLSKLQAKSRSQSRSPAKSRSQSRSPAKSRSRSRSPPKSRFQSTSSPFTSVYLNDKMLPSTSKMSDTLQGSRSSSLQKVLKNASKKSRESHINPFPLPLYQSKQNSSLRSKYYNLRPIPRIDYAQYFERQTERIAAKRLSTSKIKNQSGITAIKRMNLDVQGEFVAETNTIIQQQQSHDTFDLIRAVRFYLEDKSFEEYQQQVDNFGAPIQVEEEHEMDSMEQLATRFAVTEDDFYQACEKLLFDVKR